MMKLPPIVTVAFSLLLLIEGCSSGQSEPIGPTGPCAASMNTDLDPDGRAEALVAAMTLDARALAAWESEAHDFVVNPGEHQVLVGTASDNTPLRATITVE